MENTITLGFFVKEAADTTTSAFLETVEGLYVAGVEHLPYFIAGILVFIFFIILGRILKRTFDFVYRKSVIHPQVRILIGRLISLFAILLGILSALTVIIPSLTLGEVIAGLGFTSFIIGFATKDILNNMLSGLLILWRQPFEIGDYLYVKDRQGVVEFIGTRATSLRMDNGEVSLVPNADIYSSPITIRKAGSLLKLEIDIAVATSSNSSAIRQILFESAEKLDGILQSPEPSVLISKLGPEGLRFSLRVWADTSKTDVDALQDEILRRVCERSNEQGIKVFPGPELPS